MGYSTTFQSALPRLRRAPKIGFALKAHRRPPLAGFGENSPVGPRRSRRGESLQRGIVREMPNLAPRSNFGAIDTVPRGPLQRVRSSPHSNTDRQGFAVRYRFSSPLPHEPPSCTFHEKSAPKQPSSRHSSISSRAKWPVALVRQSLSWAQIYLGDVSSSVSRLFALSSSFGVSRMVSTALRH